MATQAQDNLETILIDYLGAIRRGDHQAVRAVLDPDVTWQGLRHDWVCHGPDEVIETLEEGLRLRKARRMEDYRLQTQALKSAGVDADDPGWR